MGIPNNIKRLRDMHGLTQAELGKIAGVSDKAISTWENGTAEPRMGAVQKIADYFDIKKSEIIDEYIDPTDGVTNIIHPSAYRIPIVGKICAGDGCFVIEEKMGYFTIDHTI
ncbi:helix-turn-helix transcriptional regulator, partial [Fusobacterium gonidiaformans]|uniref:helix-turn-helix transcriptional regulator n=1 Tax=Fusobacterium gonidiaformans TaxID=849 RepID=UPI0023F04DF8